MKNPIVTCCIITAMISMLSACTSPQKNRTTAFYYGPPISIDLLSRYEQVVIEPEHVGSQEQLHQLHARNVKVFAYVSIGEINRSRPWHAEIPSEWLVQSHDAWGSDIVDLTQEGWHEFLLNKYLISLSQEGYTGFFFDTLDSYQRAFISPNERLKQEKALAHLIKRIHLAFPKIELMLNRGFEVLPEIGQYISAVAVESLYQSWDQVKRIYKPVTKSDRQWLLNQLNTAKKKYGMQIIVIDYVDPSEKQLAKDTAQKIYSLGFTPWVTPELNKLGISALEIEK